MSCQGRAFSSQDRSRAVRVFGCGRRSQGQTRSARFPPPRRPPRQTQRGTVCGLVHSTEVSPWQSTPSWLDNEEGEQRVPPLPSAGERPPRLWDLAQERWGISRHMLQPTAKATRRATTRNTPGLVPLRKPESLATTNHWNNYTVKHFVFPTKRYRTCADRITGQS